MGTVLTKSAWTAPFWRKTGATSTTAIAVALPIGTRVVKVFVDVASIVAYGTTVTAPSTAGTNAVQTIRSNGTPTGGSFTASFGGVTTAAIPFNETAGNIQTTLNGLSTIGAAGVACAGGALPTAVTVTWNGTVFAATPIPLLVIASSVTGGTNSIIRVEATTAGANPYGYLEGGAQEDIDLDIKQTMFVYLATVAGVGNYRLSAYR